MLDRFEEKAKEILDHKDHYTMDGDAQTFTPEYGKLFLQIAMALRSVAFGGIDEIEERQAEQAASFKSFFDMEC